MYGCETWSLILREERRLRVFAKRVLRIIFGSERDEKTGEWGRGHIAEFNDLPLIAEYYLGYHIENN